MRVRYLRSGHVAERSRLRRPLIVAAALVVAACSEPHSAGPNTAVRNASVPVVTAAAMTQPMGVEIEAVGTAGANESVVVTSKDSNTITAIRFAEGEIVERGQVLVEMQDAEAQAAFAEAEAELADAQSQFTRSRNLVAQQALSVAELDQLEALLKAARARVAAMQARLDDTVIRAPFAGRTGFRQVSVGSFVSAGTAITTLDDTSVIKLDFTVPETYLFVIKHGLPVTASSTGLPGREFGGEVTNVDSRVDPITRSITVRAEIANTDGTLRPGMFMTVTLRGEEQPSLLVPEGAIVPEQGRTYVFVARDGQVEQREVTIGKRRPGEVEIVMGLAESERVVVEGTQNVRDGTAVHEATGAATVPAGDGVS